MSIVLRAEELIHRAVGSNCHIETDIKNASPSHSHDFFEIFIILDGECIHLVNDCEQPLKKGDMVFIRPDDTHSYQYAAGYSGPPCSFMNINFVRKTTDNAFLYLDNRDFVHNLLSSPLPPIVSLDEVHTEMLVKKASYLNIYEPINPEKARIAVRGVLIEMLSYFFLDYSQDAVSSAPPWFDALLVDIQRDNNFIYGLPQLTTLSGKSPGHLNRVFKKHLGITPTEYINRLKLNYAKLLLISTDMPIIEAAFEAGFDNLSHFYHLFKDMYGISPGKVKNK